MRKGLAALLALLVVIGPLPTGTAAAAQQPPIPILTRPTVTRKTPVLRLPGADEATILAARSAGIALAPGQTDLFLVLFKDRITERSHEALQAAGAEVGPYLARNTFIARLTAEGAQQLVGHDLVDAVIRYQPEWKVDPAVAKAPSSDLRVVTFGASGGATLAGAAGTARGEEAGAFVVTGATPATATQLAAQSDVLVVEPLRQPVPQNDVARSIMTVSTADGPWAHNLTGQNQVVAIADTGFDTGSLATVHPDVRGRILKALAYGRTDWADVHGHGTHAAGSAVGNGAASGGQFKGVAPEAKLVVQAVFDSNGAFTLPMNSMERLLGDAYTAGARIHSNSWNVPYAGGGWAYDTMAAQLDTFVWQKRDMTVLVPAGNYGEYGPESVTSPGTAKNAITIGASESFRPEQGAASDNADERASFSGQGAAPGGRVKPDLMAPGTNIYSTASSLVTGDARYRYTYMSGTSMATPLAAGAAALVRQYYTATRSVATPSASLIKATLINGARDMGYGWGSPEQGWGRIDLANSLYPAGGRRIWFENETRSLTTGWSRSYTVDVADGDSFRTTLAWSDAPGFAGSTDSLVNDLDLLVIGPSGQTYMGNCFVGNDAGLASQCQADGANNVENVFIANPEAGRYTVLVSAWNVPVGPQPYSLVTSGQNLTYTADTQAPTLRVQGLTAGGYVHGTAAVTAEVGDNVGVQRVRYYLDGALAYETEQAPYAWFWDTTGLTGSHQVTVKAYDYNENVTTATYTVQVDNTAPAINSISLPPDAWIAGTRQVTVNATDNLGVARVTFALDDPATVLSTDTASPFGWTWDTTATAPGPHDLIVTVTDRAGNEVSAVRHVTVDNEAPTALILNPADGSTFGAQTINVDVNATDDQGVARVEFLLDSGVTPVYTATAEPWTWAWNTVNAASGVHTVTARVVDRAGNSASAATTVTLDADLPAVTLTAPASGAVVSKTVNVTASATDAGGVVRMDFYLDGMLAFDTDQAPYVWAWDTIGLSDEPHTLQARAVDGAGNVGSSAVVSVKVDNQLPWVDLTPPTDGDWVKGVLNLEANAYDNLGLARVEFLLDAVVVRTDTQAPYQWTLDTRPLAAGDHSVAVRAIDLAGNAFAPTPKTIHVDNKAPVVTLSGLTNGAVLQGSVDLQADATDDTGVTGVTFLVNGGGAALLDQAPYAWTWETTNLPDGIYTVSATAVDAARNAGQSAAYTVVVDNRPPVIEPELPDGAWVRGTTPVRVSITDASPVVQVEYYLDGDPAPVKTLMQAPYLWTWLTRSAADGAHTITVVATDAVGHQSARSWTLNVDNTAPSISLSGLPSPAVLPAGLTQITADPVDNQGVARVEFYVGQTLDATAESFPWTWNWETSGLRGGAYTLTAKVYDVAGNSAQTQVQVTLDTASPTVAITAPKQNALLRGTVTVTASVADTGGLARADLYVDGRAYTSRSAAPFTWDWNTAAEIPGAHTLTVRAYDKAGNRTESAPVTVVIDNDAPGLTLTGADPGEHVRSSTTLTAEATEPVSKVEFYVAGVLKATDTAAPYTFSLKGLKDGPAAVTARAVDRAGNASTTPALDLVVDNTAPRLSLSGLTAGATVKGSVPLTAVASDNQAVAVVAFLVDGEPEQSTAGAPYTWTWETGDFADGTHTVQAVAYDRAGNATTTAAVTVKVDNQAPAITTVTPASGFVRGSVTVTANVTDAMGLRQVAFLVDGAVTPAATDKAKPYTFAWNTLAVADGPHTITVRAEDAGGNVSETTFSYTVDNTPPTVLLTGPAGGSAFAGGTVAVTVDTSDLNGVGKVEYLIGKTVKYTTADAPYTWLWDTMGASGAVTITARAYDLAGNVTAGTPVTVTVDGVAPKISLTGPKAGAAVGDTVTLTATASDNKGVTRVEFYVDGDLAGTDTQAPWALTWLTAGLPAGSHTLQAVAYDAAGNQAASAPVTVRIDREPPTVRLTGLTEGDLIGRGYAVTIEATDDAGIVKAEFYVDSSAKGSTTQEPFAWSLPSSIASGSHTIRVKVTDAAGHTALSDAIAVVVDTTLPTLNVSGLPSSATGVVTATVTAADNRGVDRVEVYIDGRMEYTLTDRTWVWDTVAFANGKHTVTFKAYDQAGNVTAKTLTVTVRN